MTGKPQEKDARSKKTLKAAGKFLSKTAKKAAKLSAAEDDKGRAEWKAALNAPSPGAPSPAGLPS